MCSLSSFSDALIFTHQREGLPLRDPPPGGDGAVEKEFVGTLPPQDSQAGFGGVGNTAPPSTLQRLGCPTDGHPTLQCLGCPTDNHPFNRLLDNDS